MGRGVTSSRLPNISYSSRRYQQLPLPRSLLPRDVCSSPNCLIDHYFFLLHTHMVGFWKSLLKRHVLRVVDTQKSVDTLYSVLQVLRLNSWLFPSCWHLRQFFETIGLPPKMLGSCRRTLIVLLQTSCKFPSNFILGQISVLPDSQPLGVGAFASVYSGLYSGNQVAVKRFNLYSQTLQVIKRVG